MFKLNARILGLCLLLGAPMQQSAYAAQEDIATAGDITVTLLPTLAYGATWHLDDEDGRNQLYKSFFTNLGITEVLKQSVKRERPNHVDNKSFPSGHTSISFQTATFIQQRYGSKYGIPAYFAASFVGYSRVKSDWHFGSDVLAGAAIGIITSLYFTKPYKGVYLTPVARSGEYGISISKHW